jgi:hypothetical protein
MRQQLALLLLISSAKTKSPPLIHSRLNLSTATACNLIHKTTLSALSYHVLPLLVVCQSQCGCHCCLPHARIIFDMASATTFFNSQLGAKEFDDNTAIQDDRDSSRAVNLTPETDVEKSATSRAHSACCENREQTYADISQSGRCDPSIVDWDGPDDPANPLNWTKGKKWGLIACLGTVTLVTYDATCSMQKMHC